MTALHMLQDKQCREQQKEHMAVTSSGDGTLNLVFFHGILGFTLVTVFLRFYLKLSSGTLVVCIKMQQNIHSQPKLQYEYQLKSCQHTLHYVSATPAKT